MNKRYIRLLSLVCLNTFDTLSSNGEIRDNNQEYQHLLAMLSAITVATAIPHGTTAASMMNKQRPQSLIGNRANNILLRQNISKDDLLKDIDGMQRIINNNKNDINAQHNEIIYTTEDQLRLIKSSQLNEADKERLTKSYMTLQADYRSFFFDILNKMSILSKELERRKDDTRQALLTNYGQIWKGVLDTQNLANNLYENSLEVYSDMLGQIENIKRNGIGNIELPRNLVRRREFASYRNNPINTSINIPDSRNNVENPRKNTTNNWENVRVPYFDTIIQNIPNTRTSFMGGENPLQQPLIIEESSRTPTKKSNETPLQTPTKGRSIQGSPYININSSEGRNNSANLKPTVHFTYISPDRLMEREIINSQSRTPVSPYMSAERTIQQPQSPMSFQPRAFESPNNIASEERIMQPRTSYNPISNFNMGSRSPSYHSQLQAVSNSLRQDIPGDIAPDLQNAIRTQYLLISELAKKNRYGIEEANSIAKIENTIQNLILQYRVRKKIFNNTVEVINTPQSIAVEILRKQVNKLEQIKINILKNS